MTPEELEELARELCDIDTDALDTCPAAARVSISTE
jgi:hypothetical protein